jgi:hypothetical protein
VSSDYDEANGQEGWVVQSLKQANKKLMDDLDNERNELGYALECAHQLNAQLTDILRWRKLSEEEPDFLGKYQVFWPDANDVFVVVYDPLAPIKWNHCVSPPVYWRPIGPLPKESER